MSRYVLRVFPITPFQCTQTACPKHQESFPRFKVEQQLREPFDSSFREKGCSQLKTITYGISAEAVADHEWDDVPIIGVVLPAPDPTGAQGVAGNHGVSRDIILDSIFEGNRGEPVKVTFFYVTRGYSIGHNVRHGEMSFQPPSQLAIGNCRSYMEFDINRIRPNRLLLCGPDVGTMFFPHNYYAPHFRRKTGLTVNVMGVTYPAQVTYLPYFAATFPPYLSSIKEDCAKLFRRSKKLQPGTFRLLQTLPEVLEYLDFLENHEGFVSLDYETENLNIVGPNRLGTIQFAIDTKLGVVIPYAHLESPFDTNELQIIKERMYRLFHFKNKIWGWLIHNAKFERNQTVKHFGTDIDNAPIWDTQGMAFLLDETRSERKQDVPEVGGFYSLKALSYDHLGWDGYDKGALASRSEGNLFFLPLLELAEYGAMDVWVTFALFYTLLEMADKQGYRAKLEKLTKVYYNDVSRLVAMIERNGFYVNLKNARKLIANKGVFDKKIEWVLSELKSMPTVVEANFIQAKKVGSENPKGVLGTIPWVLDFDKPATKELLFFGVLGLEAVSWSDKTHRASIDDEFYEAYKDKHREVHLYSSYEEIKKMRDTFIETVLRMVDPEKGSPDGRVDQRIRPNIHYTRLVTGRWAMTNPNLGQIPKADSRELENEADFLVRKAIKDLFTVKKGRILVQIDYKVNEVRWAAILAKDERMARIFNDATKALKLARETADPKLFKLAEEAEDIHRQTASESFGVAIDQVTKPQRNASKAITFGILFQQSPKALAAGLGIAVEKAEEYIAKFFSRMVGIASLIANLKQSAAQYSFVESPIGRRRRLWGFQLPLSWKGRRGQVGRNERQAVNSPIQGIASDAAIYGGSCALMHHIENEKKDWLIVNMVHDSCLVDLNVGELKDLLRVAEPLFVDEAMKRMADLGVDFNLPLGIDVEMGFEWGSLEKWNGSGIHADALQEKYLLLDQTRIV